jgi:hypothetical protein
MRSADVTRACAVLLLAAVTLLLVPLPGTSDVQSFWLPWMHNVSSLGIVHGYAVSASDYPPGCAIILALTHRAGHALGVDDFVALKCSIVAFLWISTWQFWRWTRRFVAFYVWAWVASVRQPKSFGRLLRFSLVGYLAYFTFNTGVHENHLFLAVIVAVALYAKRVRATFRPRSPSRSWRTSI